MRNIAYKMVNISLFFFLSLVLLENERLRSTETIMQFSDSLAVTEHQPSIFRRQFLRKVIKFFETSIDLYGCVQQHWKNGLGGTGVVDDLSCEEEILIVVLKVIFFFDVFGPFEEKDEPVYIGLNSVDNFVVLEGVNLLDLNARGSHFFDQFGEYSRIWLDSAPLIKHQF